MSIPYLPVDKANHVLYGYAIAVVASFIAASLQHSIPPRLFGVAVAGLLGAAKELWDRQQNIKAGAEVHGVEAADALSTLAGGVAFALSGLLP
jgi:hypothetical protein